MLSLKDFNDLLPGLRKVSAERITQSFRDALSDMDTVGPPHGWYKSDSIKFLLSAENLEDTSEGIRSFLSKASEEENLFKLYEASCTPASSYTDSQEPAKFLTEVLNKKIGSKRIAPRQPRASSTLRGSVASGMATVQQMVRSPSRGARSSRNT